MALLASLRRATLKDTPEDVAVLTSREVPLMGKSLPRRSFEDFPRSWKRKNASEMGKGQLVANIPSRRVGPVEGEPSG